MNAPSSGGNWGSTSASPRSARAAVPKSGHPTSSMSAADFLAVLLAKYLRYDFDHPDNPRMIT